VPKVTVHFVFYKCCIICNKNKAKLKHYKVWLSAIFWISAMLCYIMLCERVTYQFQWFSISLPVVLLRGQERNPIMAKSNSRKGFLLTKQHRLGRTERHLV